MRINPISASRRPQKFWLIAAIAIMCLGGTACKSKKPIADPGPAYESPSPEDQKIAEAKSSLQALLNSPPSRNWAELEEKERKLKAIKDMGLTDGEVYALIKQVEAQLERERIALEEEDARRKRDMLFQSLNSSFGEIASAGNNNIANAKIASAMSMFSSGDTPVLIVINQAGGNKDYDRPTTIRDYLNYLKDQQHSNNRVGDFVLDSNGKIKELELVKVN